MPETITTSTVAVTTVLSDTERLALGGFLAGYSGQTRHACSLDLRQYATWCTSHGMRLFDARRADIEAFGRALEIAGRARATPGSRTAPAVDLAVGERCEGPIFVGRDGHRLDRHAASRIVHRVARRAGITKVVGPHTLRHAFIADYQFRCRGAAPRRPGGGQPHRSQDHDD